MLLFAQLGSQSSVAAEYHLDLLGSSVPHLTANIGAVLIYIFWGL